jgi:16S rRNA (cytidine1402-2'-O)-methyltransferase
MNGKLYLVATPIGNLSDMTFRAIETLKSVDYIAAEDTRHSLRLLNHYQIDKRLESYHEHNKVAKGIKIIEDMQKGMNVALITDAGTPAISDPGEDLVKLCYENNISVTSVPGPVALITGLILSGKNTRRFAFEGFLPFQNKERKLVLEQLKTETRTTILYEAPHKLKGTLEDLYKAIGNRGITITRELTKKYEEVLSYTLEEAIAYYKANDPRGEYVLIVEGISIEALNEEAVKQWELMSLEDHMDYYLNQNIAKKEAVKLIAKDRNKPKKEIYNYFNK